MAFESKHASRIWNDLWRVRIPDLMTVDRMYLKHRGTHLTGDRKINEMIMTNKTMVMIPISKILEYFTSGVEIEIPNHEDMIKIHKHIEDYLQEWKDHIQYDINMDHSKYKKLLTDLEGLSRHIYNKAKPNEVVHSLFKPSNFGHVSNLAKLEESQKELTKPDYEGINAFIRKKTKRTRFDE